MIKLEDIYKLKEETEERYLMLLKSKLKLAEVKDMVYKDEQVKEVLLNGVFEGRKFCIMSLGSHPTAYVSMRGLEPKDYDSKYYDGVDVHCGFTFCSKSYWDEDKYNTYLGWDYAHAGDYYCCRYTMNGKKWSTEEILIEVLDVIHQLNYKLMDYVKEFDYMEKNVEELNKNYYLSSLPDELIYGASMQAAMDGKYLYVYSTGRNVGPAIETKLTVVLTPEERKGKAYNSTCERVYKDAVYFTLKRAKLCKTPRGALYRFLEDIMKFCYYFD